MGFDGKYGMRRIVCLILLVLNLCFIWGNSFLDGEQSRAISDRVIAVLVEVFHIDYTGDGRDNEPDMNFWVRKAAHAAEFAALGFLTALLTAEKGERMRDWILKALLFSVLAALTDETIQLYHGRTSSVKDVWIDSGGVLAGVLLAAVFAKRKKV